MCSVGAVNYAANGDPRKWWNEDDDSYLLHQQALDRLSRAVPDGELTVWEYNDLPNTGIRDIRNMFLDAIAEAS